MFPETRYRALPGIPMFLFWLATGVLAFFALIGVGDGPLVFLAPIAVLVMFVAILGMTGLTIVNPNEGRVITLFGRYLGSIREPGLWWVLPFTMRRGVSLRVRNFETGKLKVNDNHGNPIEIGAVVVWKVTDTAEALLEVDNYEDYVKIQSESALRALASEFPYDAHGSGAVALSTHPNDVARALITAISDRLAKAGVQVVEARIAHLAYSPEIASAMLRRQQAAAIIAARGMIVEGAVGMVENALALISAKGIVELDDERKAQMVSNLLVVLCSDRDAQPVLNAGTIYA